jgi:hypothetical protein
MEKNQMNHNQNLTANDVVVDMLCEASYTDGEETIPSKKLMQLYARDYPQFKTEIVEMVAMLLAEETFGEDFEKVGQREFLIVMEFIKSELNMLV